MVKENGSLCLWECSQCCEESERKREAADLLSKKQTRYNRVMWDGPQYHRIPRRFEGKTLSNYVAKTKQQTIIAGTCKKFIEHFDSAKENGTSLVFCGKPGTGKTHLAYAIVTALRAKYMTAVVRSAADMTAEIKEAYKSETTDVTPTTVTERYSLFDLLVIDEVGVQVSSEAEKRIFFDVINKRYENMLPTILISNLEMTELTKFVGERVMDRMNENGGVVFAFDWESNR